MRVAIVTRIFAPEASAASFRLGALARGFVRAGHRVSIKTVKPPKALRHAAPDPDLSISRFPVLRDKTGYVRGYVQYMSFDIPVFFRLLFGAKQDLYVVEPPPTTGLFVRLAATLRRTPYAYYAADVWSDAAASTGASPLVVRVVRAMEGFAMRGAVKVLSVNDGVTERVRAIAPSARVVTVGNGVDTNVFTDEGAAKPWGRVAVYSGTASEWQGASIFIDALERVLPEIPDAQIVFVGQGSDWPALRDRAAALPADSVKFIPTVPAAEAAEIMRGAAISLASLQPGTGYEFAFPTKVFASWACGTPVVYVGPGPARAFMAKHADAATLGSACDYDVDEATAALRDALLGANDDDARRRTAEWARHNVGLDAVAERVIAALRV